MPQMGVDCRGWLDALDTSNTRHGNRGKAAVDQFRDEKQSPVIRQPHRGLLAGDGHTAPLV